MGVRGRPRGFDRDEALKTAMVIFWEHGYQATTLSDLTTAMGIKPPSLYAAFDSKEELFRQAIRLYERTEAEAPRRALVETPTAREAVGALLRESAVRYTTPGKPTGCMVALSAATTSAEHAEVRAFTARCREATEDAILTRMEKGVAEGELSESADLPSAAKFYTTVLNGLAVQARDGVSRERLFAVADMAMVAWPG